MAPTARSTLPSALKSPAIKDTKKSNVGFTGNDDISGGGGGWYTAIIVEEVGTASA
jgi:hypothetical protein